MTSRARTFSGTLSDSPLGRTHTPPERTAEYRVFRPCLRLDYGFRCVYCGSHECEVSPVSPYGLFEIDHFRPKSRKQFRKLKASYGNLRWACSVCNRAKGETWPSPEEQAAGYELLDPVADQLADHLRETPEHLLEATTPLGEYFIETLDLNATVHQRRRARRPLSRRLAKVAEALAPHANGAEQAELVRLVSTLEQDEPYDAPSVCLCDGSAKSRHAGWGLPN